MRRHLIPQEPQDPVSRAVYPHARGRHVIDPDAALNLEIITASRKAIA
jgi:hypothetical protein